jgi:DNA-binding XRE family transcriptional regulator
MIGEKEMEELKAQAPYLVSFNDLVLDAQSRYTEKDWRRERVSTTLHKVSIALELRRKLLNIHRSELADMVGIFRREIVAMDLVDYYPSFEKVVEIADVLGFEILIQERDR